MRYYAMYATRLFVGSRNKFGTTEWVISLLFYDHMLHRMKLAEFDMVYRNSHIAAHTAQFRDELLRLDLFLQNQLSFYNNLTMA